MDFIIETNNRYWILVDRTDFNLPIKNKFICIRMKK